MPSVAVRGVFNFGVYRNVRISNTKGLCFYPTVVFSDEADANFIYADALALWTRLHNIDPEITIDANNATLVPNPQDDLEFDVFFGKCFSQSVIEDPEHAVENPFASDPTQVHDEPHSNLFCGICLGNFKDGEKISSAGCCNGGYHESCLKKHIQKANHVACPMCRTTLETLDMSCKRSDADQEGGATAKC